MLSPLYLGLALLLLFTTTASAAGSVLGLDFGTTNLKAVLVKPGIPLEIVLTKDSKRKETAAVAFKPNRDSKNNILAELGTFPERAYGGDALALQGRVPGEVFPNLKPLLGLSDDELSRRAVEAYSQRYPAVKVALANDLGTALLKSSAFVDEEPPWSVEELLAMELANIRRNAESMAGKGSTIQDAVITIPAFYTVDERRAIIKAASLAGLEVNALMTDGLAVGMDYAKSRTFPEVTKGEKPEYHIVYDMGAESTTATLLRFQSRSVKDVGRFNKTVQEVAVLGIGWDRTLGGNSFTEVIVNDYIHKFFTKPVLKNRATQQEEVRGNGRAMSRLWKEAERARQVLSANTETHSTFEELLPDIDFKVKLTRTEFETLASDFADRVVPPISDALGAAKLDMQDVDSIILFGGALRTPFVQKKLEGIVGDASKLRSNVNADESAVFGAAFKGAGLSPSFKVKEIRDSDIASYSAGMTYTDGGKERRQILFGVTSPAGNGAATKQIAFKDKNDFSFGLFQQVETVDRPIVRIQTTNTTDSVKALKDKFGCENEDITTKFSIKLNALDGLPEVLGGTVSCEVEGSGKAESIGDSVKGWLGLGKKDQEPLQEGDDAGPTESVQATGSSSVSESKPAASSMSSVSSSKLPEKPKKRTESISIAFNSITQGNPQPSPEEIKRMRDRLAAFDRSDYARAAREEALNVLESYTYYVRDLVSNVNIENVSTQAQRDEVSKLLAATREFMESSKDVGKATKESFTEKRNALKKLVDPIQLRRQEETERPEKISALRASLEQTEKLIEMIRAQIAQASDAKSKAEEYDASQSAAAAASSASTTSDPSAAFADSPIDSLDDLEEPDSTTPITTTSSSLGPKYTHPSDFTPYTALDLTDLSSAFDSITSWLTDTETAQSQLQPHEDPVLLSKDLQAKIDQLGAVMKDLLYKQMQKAPKVSTSKTRSSKQSSKSGRKRGSSTEAESAARVTGSEGEEGPTEEEIRSLVEEARKRGGAGGGDGGASSSSTADSSGHVADEL